MRALTVALGMLAVAGGSGCAYLTCDPLTITVARKQEYGRLEMPVRGYQSVAGRLEPIRQPTPTWEHWVQADGGAWYRVSAEEYRAAEVGQPVRVCR